MSTNKQIQAANAIAIRAFFSDAFGEEDEIYDLLAGDDGDQSIEDLLGGSRARLLYTFEETDIDSIRDAIDNLAQDILATMT